MQVNLVKNAVLSGLSNFSNVFLLLLFIAAARFLGAAEFGILTFCFALAWTISLLSDFGLSELTKRTIAREPSLAVTYVSNLIVWKILLSILAWIIILFIVFALKTDEQTRLVAAILGAGAIFKSMKALPSSVFQAVEKFELHARSQVIHNVSIFGFGILALVYGANLIIFAIVFATVKFVDVLYAYWLLNTHVTKPLFNLDYPLIKDIQLRALSFGAFAFLVIVYGYLDTFMLSIMKSDAEVGIYNAAYKIYEGLAIFSVILSQAFFPQLARTYLTNKEKHLFLARLSYKYGAIIGISVCGFGLLVHEEIISIFYGTDYAGASLSLAILLTGFLFVSLNYVTQSLIISIDKQKFLVKMILAALIINFGLNIYFIPLYGQYAAAATTTISSMFAFLIGYIYISKHLAPMNILEPIVKPLTFFIVLHSIVYFGEIESWYIVLMISLPAYLYFIVKSNLIGDFEIDLIKQYMKKIIS